MSDLAPHILRAPWTPTEGSYEAMVMAFMWDNGRTGYQSRINDIHDDFYLIQVEAGEGHRFCTFTQDRLAKLDAAIEEIVQEAVDRYDDWKTDALP